MLTFLFKLALCSMLSYMGWKIALAFDPRYGPIGLAVTSVVWGITFASYLYEVFPSIRYWARKSVLQRWLGRFYVFEGCQIRFFLIDETIWIPLSDLNAVLEPRLEERELRLLADAHGLIPEHSLAGVSEDGLMQLLKSRTGHRRASQKMLRFKTWLQNNALPNVRRLPASAANRG